MLSETENIRDKLAKTLAKTNKSNMVCFLKDCGAIFRTDGLVTYFQPASAYLTDLNRQHRNANSFAKDRKVYLKKVYDSLERELQREGCGASDHK